MDPDQQREEVTEPVTEETPPQEVQEEVQAVQPEEEVEQNTNEIEEEPETPANAAFAQLRAENKRLKEEAAQGGVDGEYVNNLRSVTKPWQDPNYQAPQYNPGITENTTFDQLNQQMASVQQTAYQAKQDAERHRMETEEMIAKEKFPELFNDRDAEQIMSEKLVASNAMGQRRSLVEIAAETQKQLNKQQEIARVQAQVAAKQRVETKQTADVQAPSTPTPPQGTPVDPEVRRRAMNRGDMDATQEAIKERLLQNW